MSLLPSLPSFDDPVELLHACHGNVRRFARALEQLAGLAPDQRSAPQAQQIARQILNYFDKAAPHHHADEEADLFPALRGLGDAALDRKLDRLVAEHRDLENCWRALKPMLEAVASGQAAETMSWADAYAFADKYRRHADFEDREVYPFTEKLEADLFRKLGNSMAERRGAIRAAQKDDQEIRIKVRI